MPRGRPGEKAQEWLHRRKADQEQRAEDRTRLLPPDLAQQIVEAADREHDLVVARIDAIDAAIGQLEADLAETRRAVREACRVVWQTPPATRTTWRGDTYQTAGRLGLVKTPEAVEIGRRKRAIAETIRALKAERAGRTTQLREIRVVKRKAQEGAVSALMHVVASWQNRVYLGGLAPAARLGRSYADAAGNLLPEEALGPDGKPLPIPTARAARAAAGNKPVMEEA